MRRHEIMTYKTKDGNDRHSASYYHTGRMHYEIVGLRGVVTESGHSDLYEDQDDFLERLERESGGVPDGVQVRFKWHAGVPGCIEMVRDTRAKQNGEWKRVSTKGRN